MPEVRWDGKGAPRRHSSPCSRSSLLGGECTLPFVPLQDEGVDRDIVRGRDFDHSNWHRQVFTLEHIDLAGDFETAILLKIESSSLDSMEISL